MEHLPPDRANATQERHQVLDMAMLGALQAVEKEGGQAGLVRHAISLYMQDASARVPALQEALARRDLDLVKQIAHGLMGSAAQIGATQVAALCTGLQARDIDLARATAQVAQLKRASLRALTALETVLQQINSD
jgi:HPt (histidine-containing phosphotransfer) domain-containing protein